VRVKTYAAILALAGCASVPVAMLRDWDQGKYAVVVHVSATPADAFRRTAAAFIAEGVALQGANEQTGFMVSTPFVVAQRPSEVDVEYHASVVAAGVGADVILWANYAPSVSARQSGRAREYVYGKLSPSASEEWARLQKIADHLRSTQS
jgi:hypothetical protein